MTTSDVALPLWLGPTVALAVLVAALWKGEWPERLGVTAFFAGNALGALLKDYTYSGPQWAGFACDTIVAIALVVIALRSNRFWPLWAAAFQLLCVVTHAARIVDSKVGEWAYITAGVICTYLVLFALAFGVYGSAKRRAVLQRQ